MLNKVFSGIAAIICAACVSMPVCYAGENSARVEISLKTGWRFHRGEADGTFMPAYDDTGWERMCAA